MIALLALGFPGVLLGLMLAMERVEAPLRDEAVGDQLVCVFVDHGFLRKDEAVQVVETFEGHFHVPLVHVSAEDRFLARLEGVSDPELKRLAWRAHHRGTKEADLLVGGFFDAHHASWGESERALFAMMLRRGRARFWAPRQ